MLLFLLQFPITTNKTKLLMGLWHTLAGFIPAKLKKIKSTCQNFTARFGGIRKFLWTSIESVTRGFARFGSLKSLTVDLQTIFGETLRFLGTLSTLPAFLIITSLVTISTFYAFHKAKQTGQRPQNIWQHLKNGFSLADIPLRSLARVSNLAKLFVILSISGSALASLGLVFTLMMTTWSSYKITLRNRSPQIPQDNAYFARVLDALFRGISRGLSCITLVEFFTEKLTNIDKMLSVIVPGFIGILTSYLVTIKPNTSNADLALLQTENDTPLSSSSLPGDAPSESTTLIPRDGGKASNICGNYQWLAVVCVIDGLLRGGLARTTNQMQLLSEISSFSKAIQYSLPFMLGAGLINSYCSTQLVSQSAQGNTGIRSYFFAQETSQDSEPTPEIVVSGPLTYSA
jgi:hypothetical protein